MIFYSWNLNTLIKEKLKELIGSGFIPLVKYPSTPKRSCVLCLYTTSDKNEMANLCKFMIDNGIIRKTSNGEYKNLSYKKEEQTKNDKYGDKFNADIKLSDFINLETGDVLNSKECNKAEEKVTYCNESDIDKVLDTVRNLYKKVTQDNGGLFYANDSIEFTIKAEYKPEDK